MSTRVTPLQLDLLKTSGCIVKPNTKNWAEPIAFNREALFHTRLLRQCLDAAAVITVTAVISQERPEVGGISYVVTSHIRTVSPYRSDFGNPQSASCWRSIGGSRRAKVWVKAGWLSRTLSSKRWSPREVWDGQWKPRRPRVDLWLSGGILCGLCQLLDCIDIRGQEGHAHREL